MNFVRIVMCAVLWHLLYVEGVKLELFLNPSDQNGFVFDCCLDRFEKILKKGNNIQRSVVVVLPGASDGFEVEAISTRNSQRINPWSVEIWKSENYQKRHEWSRPSGHAFVVIETDDTGRMKKAELAEFRSNLRRSSNVCIRKIIQNEFRDNALRAKRLGDFCTILGRNVKRIKSVSSLHVAGIVSAPFVYRVESKDELKGIDVSLVGALAKQLDATLSVDVLDANKPETPNAQHSSIGFSLDRKIDIIIGEIPQHTRKYANFNSSISYHSGDYTWCVQRARFLPLALSIFRFATPTVWLMLFGLLFINGAILYFYIPFDSTLDHRNFDFFHATFLIAETAMMGVSTRFDPKHGPLRLYYLVILLFGMAFFQIFFFNSLTFLYMRFRTHQVSSIAELLDDEFRLAGAPTILEVMRRQRLYPSTLLESFENCDNIDECLERLTLDENDDLAVGVSRTHVMHTSLFANHQIFCFDRSQNIANYSISLGIRNDYDLILKINKLIRGLLEGGLNVKWQRENRKYIPPEEDYVYTTLGFDQYVIYMYWVLIPGFFVSMGTFLLEHFVVSKIKQAQTAKKRKSWMKMGRFLGYRRIMFKLK